MAKHRIRRPCAQTSRVLTVGCIGHRCAPITVRRGGLVAVAWCADLVAARPAGPLRVYWAGCPWPKKRSLAGSWQAVRGVPVRGSSRSLGRSGLARLLAVGKFASVPEAAGSAQRPLASPDQAQVRSRAV